MRLHQTVVAKVLNAFQNLGGHSDDTKLRKFLETMDLSAYTRKESGETILVETKEYLKEIDKAGR